MKKIVCVFLMLLLTISIFAEGGILGLEWGMTIEQIREVRTDTRIAVQNEDCTILCIGYFVFAGYFTNVLMGVDPLLGLQTVWFEFLETIDEYALEKAISSKYQEVDSNWFDRTLWTNLGVITETYVELRTPIFENAWLNYYSDDLYESAIAVDRARAAFDL